MVDFDQFRQTFFEECDDCLSALEAQLMEFQAGNTEQEGIEEAFRAIHSIKGGAGAFGFDRIIAFTHEFEALLDQVRDGRVALSEDVTAAALRAFDILSDLIAGERTGNEPDADFETNAKAELTGLLEHAEPAEAKAEERAAAPDREQMPESDQSVGTGLHRFRILFRPSETMLQRGNEPILLIRELQRLGDLKTDIDLSGLPPLDRIDPGVSYLGWSLELVTGAGQAEVEEIFEFVEGDCDLQIYDAGMSAVPSPGPVPDGSADPQVRTETDAQDEASKDTAEPASARPPRNGADKARAATAYTSIRVELDRIDRMVNMVGEIVIAQAAILQQVDDPLSESHPQLVESLQQFLRHTQNLQDSVMAIRAQPVKSIFDRMPRLVRELAQQTGKKVRLISSGEETEIDKTVIEKLTDPLTHMIRNAVDHGVEMPDVRAAAGKAEEGTLRLSASQRGSHIVIELADDGKGLNREGIRRKAIERGLIAPDAQLSEQEIDNLIFRPGFSTVDTVSNISGRGVGMDVVNENIRKLGGRVLIRSSEDEGSTITLILPLTLAVMDGMVVRIGPTNFIIPLTSIIESLAMRRRDTIFLPQLGEVLRFRDRYLKIYDLHELFGFRAADDEALGLLMVIETDDGELIGLRVDEIISQQQVVVKNLEDNFSNTQCIAGGSIMGDGQVALILDVSGLRDLETARRSGGDDPDGSGGQEDGEAEDQAA
jgi:two-component system chemotaxis sensor kinase CheA